MKIELAQMAHAQRELKAQMGEIMTLLKGQPQALPTPRRNPSPDVSPRGGSLSRRFLRSRSTMKASDASVAAQATAAMEEVLGATLTGDAQRATVEVVDHFSPGAVAPVRQELSAPAPARP